MAGPVLPPRDRLQLLVLTFATLFVVAFVAFECFVIWGQYRTAITNAERQAVSLAFTITEHLEGRNRAADAALQQIAVLNKRLGGPINNLDDWNSILEAAFAGTESVGSITVIDAEGIVRTSTLPESVGQSRSDRYVFTQLRDSPRDGKMIADKPARSLQTGRMIIPIARRLEDEAGNFQGVVVATVWPEQWRNFYNTIDLGRRGMMRLMDPSGLLFHIEPARDPLPAVAPADPVLAGIKDGAPNGVVWAPLAPAGDVFVTAFRTAWPLGLVVSVSLARSDVLAPWFKELWWALGAILVLVIFTIAMAVQFIKHLSGRRGAEERFRLAVEASPSGMLIADGNGLIVLVNAAIEKMFGYARTELLGQPVEILVPKPARHLHVGERTAYFANPETRIMGAGRDLRGVRRDGSEFPVEIGLNPIHTREGTLVLGVVVDITERQIAEEKFRLAVEASPSGMLIADGRGIIVLVNAAIEKMFGYARSELIGKPIEILVPKPSRALHVGERAAYLAHPETRVMGAGRDLRGVRRDDSEFPVEIGLNPIHTREGSLVLGVVVDITERRAAQEAITQMNAELEERVRRRTIELVALNAELESFAYAVSHDLRGPIRAMDGFSQALIEDYGDKLDGEAHDFLGRIRAGSQRMGNLIDDLLKLSRVTRAEIKIEDVDLSAIAERIIQNQRESDPTRAVETRIARDLVVRGDPRLIEIAMQNLISNAWKFTSKSDQALIELGCDRANDSDTFFIRDNGAGFDNAYVDKLFKPFQRLHRIDEFEGTGIGLATVARVIRKHGGTISAEAGLGKGAIFHFTFEPESGDRI